jgi:hypothetical protein
VSDATSLTGSAINGRDAALRESMHERLYPITDLKLAQRLERTEAATISRMSRLARGWSQQSGLRIPG